MATVPGEILGDSGGGLEEDAVELTPADKLMALAGKTGDFSDAMSLDSLAKLGQAAVEEYERDKSDRKEWEDVAREALKLAAQEIKDAEKAYPWKGASNIRFPLLTTAILQFNARSYPAVVKGDEAVAVKVIGQDKGIPLNGPDGQQAMGIEGPQGMVPVMPQQGPDGQPQLVAQGPDGQPMPVPPGVEPKPMWKREPGAKAARANRVSEYMNAVLFYRIEDWESDTDTLLMQLPAVGCVFRKVWYDVEAREQRLAMVSALRIFVPKGARSCDTTPRLTEEIPDVYPYQINERMRSGYYRELILANEDEAKDGARLLLEQHRMMDLDDDGLEEPYIVTVDHLTQRVLRIEANFGPDEVVLSADGSKVLKVRRGKFYVKYGFFPHPDGNFYDLGLGHLLKQVGDVVDTALNQIIDAATAQTAGGGFIASGVRLQARGGGSTVRMEPGVYKTVDVPGSVLKDAIVERTLPNVSPVTFQVLDLILGAARDISGVKDVMTGEASNMGQVGTTLALIEQGLQVYNACYKRIFRAGKEEFTLLFRNIGRYGGEEAAKDYVEVLDDPAANFEQDFNSADFDIRPVTDPNSVTRMQKMARAQFLLGTIEMPGANPVEILKRVYEAADVEDADKLIIMPEPPPPNPIDMAKAAETAAKIPGHEANAALTTAKAEQTKFETLKGAVEAGVQMGQAA